MTNPERDLPAAASSRARLRPGPHRPSHWLPVALVVAVAAGALVGTLAVTPVAAASDQLRVAVATVYRVDPAKGAVHATLDITLTNQKPDTSTTIYYYNAASFAVPLEATSFKASTSGARLDVSTTSHKTFRTLTVAFPRLYHGKTRSIRLAFDLPGGKPRSDSAVRVGLAHAAFTAWAWGDPGLGDVRIVMPPDFVTTTQTVPTDPGNDLVAASVDGHTEYSVSHLPDPIQWYSQIEGSNQDALTDVSVTAAGEPVVIHAWPEDSEWLDRVTTILETALPDLEEAIGLPWPVSHELQVTEVAASDLEGYAGFFDSTFDQITISEELDDLVIVHEASHAWFDGALFQERWIDEGLADEYASRILAADRPGDPPDNPSAVSAADPAAFDLNTWRPPARIDSQSAAYEQFGYDASWTVMRAIVDDATEAGMRSVFKAAAARTLTYVGAGPAESAGFVPDWRRFLDLVTDVGGSTKAEGLLETWVLTPAQDAELTARDAARTRYFALVSSGDGWSPGVLVRKPMSDWQFDDAEAAMAAAETVIADRDVLAAATTDLGLPMPAGLEPAYESADSTDDLAALDGRIADWTAAAAAVRAARDDLAGERPPLVALGLVDVDPRTGYEAALTAFAAGDDKAVLAGTAATMALLDGAEEVGRGRAMTAAGVVLLLLVLLALVAVRRRGRRPAAVAVPMAPVAGSPGWDQTTPAIMATPTAPAPEVPPPPDGVRRLDLPGPPARADGGPGVATDDPYATLAATPDLAADTEAGEGGARGAESD